LFFFSNLGPVVSALSNKFSTRAVVVGGAIVTSSVYVISAFSSSIYFMMVGFGFIGGKFIFYFLLIELFMHI
jgi:hypothetical protein